MDEKKLIFGNSILSKKEDLKKENNHLTILYFIKTQNKKKSITKKIIN